MRGSCQPRPSSYSIINMWSVKTVPKASVSSAGGCLGVVVLVMAIWVKAISWTWGERERQLSGDHGLYIAFDSAPDCGLSNRQIISLLQVQPEPGRRAKI